ncbi:MAG: hypothetical protein AB7O59_09825 [Pirellulales bacterium]
METEHDEGGAVGIGEGVTLFVHIEGRDAVKIEAALSELLADVLARAGLEDVGAHHIFIGECVEALDEADDVNDGEDCHEPVHDHRKHLHHHRIRHGGHIHCHPCRRIKTEVTYNGADKHHRFSPAATVETVRRWALRKFKIGPVDGETLILKIIGIDKPPSPDAHVGDLVRSHSECRLSLELVPDHGRING